jgi:hypothetical protein
MAPKTPLTSFQIALLFVVAIALFVVYQKYIAPPDGHPATDPGSAMVYDTDPENDLYIKGELTSKQLTRFDRILEREKENRGLRLSGGDLSELAGDDRELIDAYYRWCSCKDMMRSSSHIVYPSERNSLRKKD